MVSPDAECDRVPVCQKSHTRPNRPPSPLPPPSGATYKDVKEYGKFEDEDFMAELSKPIEEKKVPIKEYMREEACEPWKEYQSLPDTVHY